MKILDFSSKYQKFIILSGLLLGIFSVIDKVLAVGLIFVAFLFGLTFYFISLIKDETQKKILAILFISVFLLYILLALFFYYSSFQPFSNGYGDNIEYHEQAKNVATAFSERNFSLQGVYFYHYYPVILGYLYLIFIPSLLIGLFFNSWLIALSIVFVYLIVHKIGGSEKESFIVGFLACFYPSLVFYGNLLLKDGLVIMLSMLSLLLTIKIVKRFSLLDFLILYGVLIALMYFRFYIAYAIILAFVIGWVLISGFTIKKRIVYALIMLLCLGFIPIISKNADFPGGGGYMGINFITTFINPEVIVYYRELAYPVEEGTDAEVMRPKFKQQYKVQPEKFKSPEGYETSSVIIETGIKSPLSFIKNTGLSFVQAFLGPFPWQLRSLRQFLALPEVIAWYVALFFVIRGVINSIRKKNFFIIIAIVFSLLVFGVLALYINNFGIITRIRIPAVLALLCLAPFGFNKLKKIKVPLIDKVFEK